MIPANVIRQRWTKFGTAILVVAALVVGILGLVGVRTLANSKAGRRASTLPAAQSLPVTPAALLAVKAESGALMALVVLVKAPKGANGKSAGGTIIPLPVGSGIRFGDNPEMNRLAELYLAGGIKALATQAASLLSINFSVVAEADASAVATLLSPVGQVTVKQAAGQTSLMPAAAATMLSSQESRNEGPHFESTVAYWEGLAKAVGKGKRFTPSQTNGAITIFFGSILSGPIAVYPLRGTRVPKGEANSTGADVYELDALDVNRVMALVLPNAYSPVDVQYTVRIVNPTGDPNLTREAIRRVNATDGGVAIVEEPKKGSVPVPKKTEVSLSGRLEQVDSKQYTEQFGAVSFVDVGEPGSPHMRYADIDLTIVLGQPFAALAGGAA